MGEEESKKKKSRNKKPPMLLGSRRLKKNQTYIFPYEFRQNSVDANTDTNGHSKKYWKKSNKHVNINYKIWILDIKQCIYSSQVETN